MYKVILICAEMRAVSCPRGKFLNISEEFHCLWQDMQDIQLCRSDLKLKDKILTFFLGTKLYYSQRTNSYYTHIISLFIRIKIAFQCNFFFFLNPALQCFLSSYPKNCNMYMQLIGANLFLLLLCIFTSSMCENHKLS